MIVNWPELSDKQIELKAAQFREQALSALKIETSSAVPVEQIAEMHLGYDLEFVEGKDKLPGDVIGGIDFDSNTIIINAAIESHIGRYSFTIAHEIAHHVLHRELFLQVRSGASIMCRGGEKRPIEEFQADRFAEALLMPTDLIKEHHRKVKSRNIFKLNNQFALASKVIESSGLDNVSVSAMVVRLNHLGLTAKKPFYQKLYSFIRRLVGTS
ncbi:MAG: ImmA/IrrE family metallo-endopeptidase [Porticoccaceae bacterium]|nr:ImmA/IrrE family metallo-endopeptidase [Porticoccaceae bacterium]